MDDKIFSQAPKTDIWYFWEVRMFAADGEMWFFEQGKGRIQQYAQNTDKIEKKIVQNVKLPKITPQNIQYLCKNFEFTYCIF